MAVQIIVATVTIGSLVGFVAMAVLGLGSVGRATERTVRAGGTAARLGPAPRRSRPARTASGDRRARLLPPEATVTFAALDSDLVGLAPVKQKVQEIAALLLVDVARRKFGLEAPRR